MSLARVLDTCPERRAHVRVEDVETAASERRAHVIMQVLSEALQVMRLLQKVVRVKALLVSVLFLVMFVLLMKALLKEVFSLLSPLTQTQTTMPQTRPGGA